MDLSVVPLHSLSSLSKSSKTSLLPMSFAFFSVMLIINCHSHIALRRISPFLLVSYTD